MAIQLSGFGKMRTPRAEVPFRNDSNSKEACQITKLQSEQGFEGDTQCIYFFVFLNCLKTITFCVSCTTDSAALKTKSRGRIARARRRMRSAPTNLTWSDRQRAGGVFYQ
jgi:hypothetical protein